VAFHPKSPQNSAIAISLIRGELIRKAKVTPKGIPPLTKPMNRGMEEQEQKGVTAPRRTARKYSNPYNFFPEIKLFTLSTGK
jgi:hypothetical protein